MIRKGTQQDIPHIAAIYEHIHDNEESGKSTVGWIRGVYPTADTARAALEADDLFVMEENGAVVAVARINKIQVPVYADVPWCYPDVLDEQVMVLHTLVVEPACSGKGYGTAFVKFYEDYARENGCPYLRPQQDGPENVRRSRLLGGGHHALRVQWYPRRPAGLSGKEAII